jgi:hypothetical protein
MFRFVVAFATLFACVAANAHQLTVSGTDTVRLGSKVISAGDKRARVIEAGGEPPYVRQREFGERMIYRNGQNGHIVIDLDESGIVIRAVSVISPVNIKDADP